MSLSSFIWSVADLLRDDYRQSEYSKVILPFIVLRRMDCMLDETKKAVLAENTARQKAGINPEPFLLRKAKQSFYNTSPMDMKMLMGDQDHIKENLYAYIQAFSPSVRDIFERFDFYTQIDRLAKSGLLYQVAEKFAGIDLHPDAVSNTEMGTVFEELIRKFSEISNETAGEHFTPREVIRLMVNLIFVEDDDVLSRPGVVRTIYDPAAGTGGMLSVAGEYLAEHNPQARLADGHVLQHRHLHLRLDSFQPQAPPRKGKVQLIDASGFWQKMRKSLGSMRKELSDEHIAEITRIFGNFRKVTKDGAPISRIFRNEEFG